MTKDLISKLQAARQNEDEAQEETEMVTIEIENNNSAMEPFRLKVQQVRYYSAPSINSWSVRWRRSAKLHQCSEWDSSIVRGLQEIFSRLERIFLEAPFGVGSSPVHTYKFSRLLHPISPETARMLNHPIREREFRPYSLQSESTFK